MRKILLTAVLIGMFTGAQVQAGDDILLAKVGDRKIMMSDFNRMISYYDTDMKKALEENPIFKATILQRIVQGMVLSKIARDGGFDKKTDIKEQIELLTNDFLATQYLISEVVGKINVSEDDMKLYYKMHGDEFRTPEMVRARHILVAYDKSGSEDIKKKAKEKTEALLKRVKAGEDLAKLASEYSDDTASRSKGGDMGFFSKGKMIPDFEKAAFSLKPGEVSDVVETQAGFHIIKLEEKKESVPEPYDSIKDKVKDKVLAEFKKARVGEFAEKAMKDAGVELNLDPFLPKK